MNPLLTSILSSSVIVGLFELVKTILERRWKKKDEADKKDSVEATALKALLHDRLYEKCEECLAAGEVSIDAYDNLKYMYEPYVLLGGNGTCARLMKEVEKLPIKKEAKYE